MSVVGPAGRAGRLQPTAAVTRLQPRAAPVPCPDMTPPRIFRSFAITFAIAITILGPGARGFAIDRSKDTPDKKPQAINLLSDGPIELSVTDEPRAPNNTKTNKNEDSGTTVSTTVDNNKSGGTTIQDTQNTPQVKTEITLTSTQATSIRSTTEFARIPTISSDTVEVFDSVEDTFSKDKLKNNDVTTTEESVKNITFTLETTTKPYVTTLMSTEEISKKTNTPLQSSSIDDVYNKIPKIENNDTNEFTTPMLKTIEDTADIFTTEVTSLKSTKANNATVADNTMIITELPETIPNTSSLTPLQTDKVKLSDVQETTEKPLNKFTDPFLGKYTQYTTIIRKRVTSSEESTTTTDEDDMMKAETSNTVVNFEKAFNVTPIPSLEKLRVELLANVDQRSTNTKRHNATEKQVTELSTIDVIENTVAKRQGTVQTKRAGYIDNTEKITTPLIPSRSSSEITTTSELIQETVPVSKVKDSEATETESYHPEKVGDFESQSQLAEDARQEEFLKEEALQNFEENFKRSREEFSHEVKPIQNDFVSTTATPNNSSMDDLSVQPIEKYKTTLYTVSPNYKPMKKLDVQPAKPFVRDPDDNSWRNESISSLGIVFKPKNSSKSFKEVLKNKTQTELNNLIERAKDEVPDLRVRLEKIAEVRKIKKKKMTKDGEVVYTDYEEGSSSETTSSTPKLDLLSSLLTSEEVYKLMPPQSPQTYPETTTTPPTTTSMTTTVNTTEAIIKRNRTTIKSIFSSLGLDGLTTTKPEKFFNAAEYYDTTDEYDADYVTMSKLDLKRFTMPAPIATRPLPAQTSKLLEPHIPERRPTVQYFPPREPQKVNVNHIDKDFERKINLFTYKEQPREPRPPFVTVPPLPIATENPQEKTRPLLPMRVSPRPKSAPDARSTVRPSDFTMITPQDLNRNFYMTSAPRSTEPQDGFLGPHLDRGSYVIKHYKDFLHDVAKGDEERRKDDFLPFHSPEPHTAPPELDQPGLSTVTDRPTYKSADDEEDYDTRFHKEVLSRFVDNFNQNSERFKVDFPILYNNSVVHRAGAGAGPGGAAAASRAFLKRYYGGGVGTQASALRRPCEPHCELTVELSPAYELHYYVPGQEEKEEPRTLPPPPLPYRYGL